MPAPSLPPPPSLKSGSPAIFDGSQLSLPAGAGRPSGRKLLLIPPAISLQHRPLPRLPAAALLRACASGLLWRQLFADPPAGRLIGWSRRTGRPHSPGRSDKSAPHSLLAVFSEQTVAQLLDRIQRQAQGALPCGRLRLYACAKDRVQSPDHWIALNSPPMLFSRLSGRWLAGLFGLACLGWMAVLFAGIRLPAAPSPPQPEPQAASIGRQVSALRQSLRRTEQYLQTRRQIAERTDTDNDRLRRLAGLISGRAAIRRLQVSADAIELHGVSDDLAAVQGLPRAWAAAGGGAGVLQLEKARRQDRGQISFSASLRSDADGR